jgi:hypothetical protein
MSQWTEQLRTHTVWPALEALGPSIDEALKREGLDPSLAEQLVRVGAILAVAGKRLAGADAHTMSFAILGQVANSLVAANSEIRAFIANGNPGHVTNATANADAALPALAQLAIPSSTEDFVGAKEAADRYRRALDSALAFAKESSAKNQAEIEALRARLDELTAAVGAEKQRLTSLTSEQQSQFSTAQDARAREWTEDERGRGEKFTALVASYTKDLSEQVAELVKVRETARKDHSDALAALRAEFMTGAEGIRKDLELQKKKVEDLVGVIGNLGLTAGHSRAADEARTTSRVWQGVAVTAMIGLIGMAIYAMVHVVAGEFAWNTFAARVFVSVTFGVLAAYAAAQADKYQKREVRDRQMALELEALGSFLAPLPTEKAETFRLSVGERAFGRGDLAAPPGHERSPATALDVLNSKDVGDLVIGWVRKALKP